MSEHGYSWQRVVDCNPRGCAEFNDGKTCVYGPIESVTINKDYVVCIKLKWAAQVSLNEEGMPKGEWRAHNLREVAFGDLTVPYMFENTTEKGQRVRFGVGNLIYLDEGSLEGEIDPKKLGIGV